MMRTVLYVTVLILSLCTAALAGGEIQGTITTNSGDELTGSIRWDRNENFWGDVLNASKLEVLQEDGEPQSGGLSFFGMKIGPDDHRMYDAFSIQFGHLASIEPRDETVLLTLKNGEQIEVRSDSSDLGHGMRDLFIDDATGKRVDLPWRRLKRVEFQQGDSTELDRERLYGEVTTLSGPFTGTIVWDADESMLEDVLDGDEDGVDHEVAFRDIVSIERQGTRSSKVTLRDGTVLDLGGTNDVASGHRGVVVDVPMVGHVSMDWDQIEKVTFAEPPPSPPYSAFDGGRALVAAVRTTEGQVYGGEIIWDQDESHTWETLDGQLDAHEYAILFSNILSIRRLDSSSCKVVLASGRVLRLSDGQDVGDDHRGVTVIEPDDTQITIDWKDVDLVVF
jgi:hypothetical protein